MFLQLLVKIHLCWREIIIGENEALEGGEVDAEEKYFSFFCLFNLFVSGVDFKSVLF
jgi:hypothetical protein